MWQIIVSNVVGAIVIAVGGWLYTRVNHKWKNFSAKLDELDELSAKLDKHELSAKLNELSAKLDKHETAPTGAELSAKLDEHETERNKRRNETAATLAGHGEKLANLEDGQANLGDGQANLGDGQAGINRKLDRIDRKLERILGARPAQS